MKIKELLTDESKWTKGAFARTIDNAQICSASQLAVCFCLQGAMFRCYTILDEFRVTRIKILKELRSGDSIASWNDAPERTFAEVKALVEKLDI